MSTSERTAWIAGAALLAGAAAAAVIVLGYVPQADETARTREAIAEAETANARLEQRLAELQAESANLPAYQTQLAALRGQFPTSLELSNFTRYLQGLADAAGLVVQSIQIGSPTLITDLPVMPEAPDGTEAPALPEPVAGLYSYSISMKVTGSLDAAKAYIGALQGEDHNTRLFLAPNMTWASEAQGGEESNAQEMFAIDGMTFALIPFDQIPVPEAPPEESAEGADDTTNSDDVEATS
jgi:hypothetical protein